MNKDPLLFRLHRGSLDEAMATVIEIESYDHLIAHILLHYSELTFIGLQVEPYVFDTRIGWDTHIVRGVLGVDPVICYPVGFLNRRPPWLNYKDNEGL